MKNTFQLLVLAFAIVSCASGAEPVKLEPNSILHFEFPDLPATMAAMAGGSKTPAGFTVQLPENYSREGKFPLCVYLNGGNGGLGDAQGTARAMAGPLDFISVNLPLFKRAGNTNDGLISIDDFETISHAYDTMLQKLLDAVPNIATERSVFGGFSNGAHTAALLIAGQDEFILSHFPAFYFAEGGAALVANTLQKHALKRVRFLFLHSNYADSTPGFEGWGFINHAIEQFAKSEKLDFTTIVMQKTGHDFPPKYMAIAGQWIRGEKLPQTDKD